MRRAKSAPPGGSPDVFERNPPFKSSWQIIGERMRTFFGLNFDTAEDWNARRLRYTIRKYGNIKPEKLCKTSDISISGSLQQSISPRKPNLERQVSLLTQLGTPVSAAPFVYTKRNSALKVIRNAVRNSTSHLKRGLDTSSGASHSDISAGVLHLPAGRLISPAAPSQSPFFHDPWQGTEGISLTSPKTNSWLITRIAEVPSISETNGAHNLDPREMENGISLQCARPKLTRQASLHELVESPLVLSPRSAKSINDLSIRKFSPQTDAKEIFRVKRMHPSRFFFPSSSASNHSRSRRDSTFDNMLRDFEMDDNISKPVSTCHAVSENVSRQDVVSKGHYFDELDSKLSSRLTSQRPAPLKLDYSDHTVLGNSELPSAGSRRFHHVNFGSPWLFLQRVHPEPAKRPNQLSLMISPTNAFGSSTFSPGFTAFVRKNRHVSSSLKDPQCALNDSHSPFVPFSETTSDLGSPYIIQRLQGTDSVSLGSIPSPSPYFLPSTRRGLHKDPSERSASNIAGIEESHSEPLTAAAGKDVLNSEPSWWMVHKKRLFQLLACSRPWNEENAELYRRIGDSCLDYRPFFTYFVSFVQLVVMIIACLGYGFAPAGLNLEHEVTGEVLLSSLVEEHVCRVEDENPWLGPRQADLIRIGARYSPCMRPDVTLRSVVNEAQKQWDRNSGCCVRNDGEGCYQASRLFCTHSTSTWFRNGPQTYAARWLHEHEVGEPLGAVASARTGPVCGLDPEFCEDPRSTGPFTWSNDVAEWPICRRMANISTSGAYAEHMRCEVTARPCCVGIKGECIVTTVAHCSFLRGHYHQEAALCSQVNCLGEVCGMIPFLKPEKPDQWYRIFISLFLHAGIVHLCFSLLIQLVVLRNLEKLLGWCRVSFIFILSGCFSSLVSGIMLPYHVHTGPTGAHFAIFGVVFVDYLQTRDLFQSPWTAILQQVLLILFVFLIGFLPWLDNYAHISGFFSGLILAYVFVPYLGFGVRRSVTGAMANTSFRDLDHSSSLKHCLKLRLDQMRQRRFKVVLVCSIVWLLLFISLLMVFENWPLTNCSWCKYLNCLPWKADLCNTLEVNVHAPTRCIHPHT